MWDDHAADIDEDIQGNSTSDLLPNHVMPTAEDVEEVSISRKAHAVIICFLTILLKWFCRYNIGINAIDTLPTVLHSGRARCTREVDCIGACSTRRSCKRSGSAAVYTALEA